MGTHFKVLFQKMEKLVFTLNCKDIILVSLYNLMFFSHAIWTLYIESCGLTMKRLAGFTLHHIVLACRVFWGCLIGITTTLLCQNVYLLGTKVTHSNVELIVDNPNYSLENVDFPAVTICSNSKVMKSKLARYLKYLRTIRKQQIPHGEEVKIVNFVLAMDLMKHPFLHHSHFFVEYINNSVYYLPNEDIFDIMTAVKPRLSDMIHACRWRGRMFKCKQLFRKQMTEEGFCYSFNSRTAQRSLDDLPRLPPEELADGTLECLRNNAAGRDVGLSFALKSLDQETFKKHFITRGYSIMVHNPNSYPTLSHKYFVFWKNYTFTRINVMVTTVKTDETFSRITESARGCKMTVMKTLYSCRLNCRKREILKHCGCLPYYMYHLNRHAETCGIQHLKCLKENNLRFRNDRDIGEKFQIPTWSLPQSMNCECELPCSSTSYVTEYSFVPKEEVSGSISNTTGYNTFLGFVEIAYKNNYATSYIRRARFTFSDFLVDVGSLAGLFLGCSIVTMIELSVFLYKLSRELYFRMILRNSVIHPFIE